MLHGGYLDHHHMMTAMEPLFESRAGWRRIYPDMPGHGKTPDSAWITNLEQVLKIILEFVDSVIPGQSIAVAGMSRGGYLARGLITLWPERIDGVMLDAPSTVPAGEESSLPQRSILARDTDFESDVKQNEQGLFNSMFVVHDSSVLARARKDLFPAFKLAGDDHHKKIIENFAYSFDMDTSPVPFDKPGLMLLGRQDHMVGYSDAWSILESFPRTTFAVLDKSGHFLQMEQSDLFTSLDGEWLDRVEEFAGASHRNGLRHLESIV